MCVALGIEPRALPRLGKSSPTELHTGPGRGFLLLQFLGAAGPS